MYITTQTIVAAAGLVSALAILLGMLFKAYSWYQQQNQQDKEIADLKHEQGIMCEGILATLDGLEQLGCNHSVPKAKKKLNDHIISKAHE